MSPKIDGSDGCTFGAACALKCLCFDGLLSFRPQVVVTVDGTYSERWITAGSFTLLASSTVFVGGSEATYNLKGNNNWVGCLKKVRQHLYYILGRVNFPLT